MMPGSAIVAACVMLNSSALQSDLVVAAMGLSKLVVTVPKDALPLVQKRASDTLALVRFIQHNSVEVWVDCVTGQAFSEGRAANMIQAHRDLESTLGHLGHPHGLAESFRIQRRFLDAWDREQLIARNYVAVLRPSHEISLASQREVFTMLYRNVVAPPSPNPDFPLELPPPVAIK
jgi:hypothetical protein